MSPNLQILIVDQNPTNIKLLEERLSIKGHDIKGISTLDALDDVLDEANGVDMALVDVTRFESGVWTRLQKLRKQDIPFLVLSPGDPDIEQRSVSAGATASLSKPIQLEVLQSFITQVQQDTNDGIEAENDPPTDEPA